MKTLSFIIPLYNSAKWLRKCLESVLNQDIPLEQMEVICVNDGSPDNSADIAREYQNQYPNTIIVLDQANEGPSSARNNGMRHATGKYLCFVDPDDYVEPNVYGRLVKQMEDERLDMLRFNYQIVDVRYQPVEKRDFEKRFDYSPKLMSGAEFIATRLDIACNIWRYIYRRELITKNNIWCFVGDYYDDTPWLPLVLLKAERMNICDTVVYDYMVRSDSLVKTRDPKMIKRKTDGALRLLGELRAESVQCTVYGVQRWYKMMQAHIVVGMLTDVAVFLYAERETYLKQLRDLNIFPIQPISLKARLINLSPSLAMLLIHAKNRG